MLNKMNFTKKAKNNIITFSQKYSLFIFSKSPCPVITD